MRLSVTETDRTLEEADRDWITRRTRLTLARFAGELTATRVRIERVPGMKAPAAIYCLVATTTRSGDVLQAEASGTAVQEAVLLAVDRLRRDVARRLATQLGYPTR